MGLDLFLKGLLIGFSIAAPVGPLGVLCIRTKRLLEDRFDPRRLQKDCVPTGWKDPPCKKTRTVKSHEFGLDLSEKDERNALIAFLRTL